MSQKEPLSRPVLITGVVVPIFLGLMAIFAPLLTARLQPPPGSSTTGASSPLPTPSTPQQTDATTAAVADDSEADGHDVTVAAGNTANVFSGKVFIALLKTEEDGKPPHDTVYATLSSDDAGIKDRPLEGVDAGYSTIFNGFKIRVMSVAPNSAHFRITRLPTDPTSEPTAGPRH